MRYCSKCKNYFSEDNFYDANMKECMACQLASMIKSIEDDIQRVVKRGRRVYKAMKVLNYVATATIVALLICIVFK